MVKYTFYSICCKSKDITDFYIGSTTDIKQRKHQHKFHSTNPNSLKRHQAKYQAIINNGGIDNWKYMDIGSLDCTVNEALIHERELIDALKPSLNIRKPIV